MYLYIECKCVGSINVFLFLSNFTIHRDHKSGVKRLNTFGHLDQYMAQHGSIVKQSYCETVLVTILFNSN